MEDLLYYIWQQRIFTRLPYTPDQQLEILDPGMRNYDAGPDFFNAKLKMGDTIWAGNVEMHVRATDWYRHGHATDPAYDSVILHGVMHDDGCVTRPDGQPLMQVTLPVPDPLLQKYRQIVSGGSRNTLPCAAGLRTAPRLIVSDWMTALATERMTQKTDRVRHLIAQGRDSWPEACYIILARAFGTGVNGDAFERLARSIPYNVLLRHQAQPIQIQALLMGQAGFLAADPDSADPRHVQLREEYIHLAHMYHLTPLPVSIWKLGGVRPQAMPTVRIRALAALLSARPNLFSEIRQAPSVDRLMELLIVPKPTTPPSDAPAQAPGRNTLHSLIINAVVPLLVAYGKWTSDEALLQRALSFLEALPAEKNRYVGFCTCAGLTARNAFDSQALIQLYRNYCERRSCLRCRLGHWMMKH
jgi:hypothetical protein